MANRMTRFFSLNTNVVSSFFLIDCFGLNPFFGHDANILLYLDPYLQASFLDQCGFPTANRDTQILVLAKMRIQRNGLQSEFH